MKGIGLVRLGLNRTLYVSAKMSLVGLTLRVKLSMLVRKLRRHRLDDFTLWLMGLLAGAHWRAPWHYWCLWNADARIFRFMQVFHKHGSSLCCFIGQLVRPLYWQKPVLFSCINYEVGAMSCVEVHLLLCGVLVSPHRLKKRIFWGFHFGQTLMKNYNCPIGLFLSILNH